MPERGKGASLAVDEVFVEGDFFRDGGDDDFPVFVVIEFSEKHTPWRLNWRRGGGCDYWQFAHEVCNSRTMVRVGVPLIYNTRHSNRYGETNGRP